MDVKQHLKENLTHFIEINNKCNELSERLSELKENKNNLESELIEFMKENHMDNKMFSLNEYKIQHKCSSIYQQMSLKFIESNLSDYFKKNNIPLHVEDCISFLKDKREKKEKEEIKIQFS